jgi:hypothetical protein
MTKARKILAVTLVATALCADRAATRACAVPQDARAHDGRSMAGRLVSRLSSNFRRVLPAAVQLRPSRSSQVARTIEIPTPQVVSLTPPPLNPFQFRLPPPQVT